MSATRLSSVRTLRGQPAGTIVLWLFAGATLAWSAPAVTAFSPSQGPVGTQVVLTGSGLDNALRVEFNGVPTDFQVASASRVVATVPPEAMVGPIQVVFPTGPAAVSSASFTPSPRLLRVSPSRAATNTFVVIEGANLLGTTQVLFGERAATFTVVSAGAINVRVPAITTHVTVTVQAPAGTAVAPEPFIVTGPAPVVDRFSPQIGAPGTLVQIEGINFTNVSSVKFGTANAAFSTPTPQRIDAFVPGNADTGAITVTTPGGSAVTSDPFTVTYAPVITGFDPALGKAGSTSVDISGLNFSNVTAIAFNGVTVPGFFLPTAGVLRTTVPANATSGPITVTNRINNVNRGGTSSAPFTVTAAPVIFRFNPALGKPGETVVLTGINFFTQPTTVFFGTQSAAFSPVGQMPETINAIVPASATTGPITISNQFGIFTTADHFSVLDERPYLATLWPPAGPRGTQVTLTGYNFSNPIAVSFNGALAPETTTASPFAILVTVPPNATPGRVTVTTPAGTTTNAINFLTPPRLTNSSPTSGFVGQPVRLEGAGLTNTLAVDFAGTAAAFTAPNDGTLLATVPDGAGRGPIRVTTPGGVVMTAESFVVLPEITAFEPALGPTLTPVTLYGTSLRGVTGVSFNNRPAVFTNVSSTVVRTVVPANTAAGPAPIRITTTEGSFTTTSNFVVTTSSDLSLSLTATTNFAAPGQSIGFHAAITNRGLSAMTGVRLTQNLPPGLELVDLTTSQGSWSRTNQTVVVDLGAVLTNASAQAVQVILHTRAVSNGVWTTSASVDAIEDDYQLANNEASLEVTVLDDAHRTLEANLTPAAGSLVLSWPQSPVPLVLQTATELPPTNGWQSAPGSPVLLNGLYYQTNAASDLQRFYRLITP